MGWTSYHAEYYKNGKIDRKAELDAYFMEGLNRGHFNVKKSAMVGSVYYAAIETLKRRTGADENGKSIYVDIPEDERETWAAVFLTSTDKKDYFNFSYKDMDETMGPCDYKCPTSILNLLTPTESEWANEWRKKCREYNKNKGKKDWLQELPIGGKIIFTRPDGRKQNLVKHEPAFQFRTWFWYDPDYHQYVSKKYVTINNAVPV